MGMLPSTPMRPPSSWASTGKVTLRVTPRRVRSPVAVAVSDSPSAGTAPKSMGAVSTKVAVGNSSTDMMRLRN